MKIDVRTALAAAGSGAAWLDWAEAYGSDLEGALRNAPHPSAFVALVVGLATYAGPRHHHPVTQAMLAEFGIDVEMARVQAAVPPETLEIVWESATKGDTGPLIALAADDSPVRGHRDLAASYARLVDSEALESLMADLESREVP